MKSRKSVLQFIASRYGLGYAEINNKDEVYLISAYLPNHPEVREDAMPSIPLKSEHDLLYDAAALGTPKMYSSIPRHLVLSMEGPLNYLISTVSLLFRPYNSPTPSQSHLPSCDTSRYSPDAHLR